MRGKSRQQIANLIRNGRIRLTKGPGSRKLIDWRAADASTGWAPPEREDGSSPLPPKAESERRKEHWIAQTRELEYHQKAGELHPVEDTEGEGYELGRLVRDRWQRIGARTCNAIASLGEGIDAREVEDLINREIDSMLEGLATEQEEPDQEEDATG